MSDKKISALPKRTSVGGADIIPILSDGVNYKADAATIAAATKIVEITASSYTLSAVDDGALLYFTNAVVVVVPAGLSSKFSCRMLQGGTGRIRVVPSGTTLRSTVAGRSSATQYTMLSLLPLATNVFLLSGNLTQEEPEIEEPEEPPVNTELPTIERTGEFDFSLTATNGVWTGDPEDFRYQWSRNAAGIVGAEGQNYAVLDEDLGTQIRVTVTAENAYGEASATSLPLAIPSAILPVNTAVPVISGLAAVGTTLSTSLGTWTSLPAPEFAIFWRKEGAILAGETGSTYLVRPEDLGENISVTVRATNIIGSVEATSAETATVVPGTDVTPAVLSSLSVEPNGETAAFITCNTTEGNGTFYWVVVPDGSPVPTALQVKAGQDGAGATAERSGSVFVSSINTYGTNPTGLSAGQVYDCYAVLYDIAGNPSNVVTDQFTTAGSPIPLLTSQSAYDFSDIFARIRVTTNNSRGTLYTVIVPASDTAPSIAQIKLGQNSAGAAAPNDNMPAGPGTGMRTFFVEGLTPNTAYKAYIIQNVPAGDSAVLTVSFTTDVLVKAFANGTIVGANASTGTDPVFTLVPGPPGTAGNVALRWKCKTTSPLSAGQVLMTFTVNPYAFGDNKYHFSAKRSGGVSQYIRVTPANVNLASNAIPPAIYSTWGGSFQFNAVTGVTAASNWYIKPISLDLGDGWFAYSGVVKHGDVGSDQNGSLSFYMGEIGSTASITAASGYLDGTHWRDIYDVRITRPAL